MSRIRRSYEVLSEAAVRFVRHDGSAYAGYIAYSTLLALLPFLIFATSMAGVIIGPENSQKAVDALFELAPVHVAKTIEPVLVNVLSVDRSGLAAFSILVSFFVASNAIGALRVALDRAYEVEETRGIIVQRLIALGFILIGSVLAVTLGLILVLLPFSSIIAELFNVFHVPLSAQLGAAAVAMTIMSMFLALLHRGLTGRPFRRRRLWPGVILSAVLLTLTVSAFSFYLRTVGTYALTYGALAGVIVTLLVFYFTGVSVIFGAEVNAVLHRRLDAQERAAIEAKEEAEAEEMLIGNPAEDEDGPPG
ncbi:YihY/virulence factor BrkB family protein [Oceanomicrobium pacificus]|uniref:YihY family inner membrane protein n=1 Tax=Oceanomicrobium pacificus TaxID=2692916 RepID=A0A6B0TNV6_9RHOB|nr:YihY/virulence factor BrkB family protein [Oceanomicrobium pacificus]MXU66290.1 YihY family inner membrane protein [Oceanomicrobium pacificus]